MPPISIIGISGSTRRGSFNSALLRAAASSLPEGAQLRIESIASIPLYNGDEEAARGIPEAVARLKDAIAQADGLLLVSPEYNNSLPGVARSAMTALTELASRPTSPAFSAASRCGDCRRLAAGRVSTPRRPRTHGSLCSRPSARSSGPAGGFSSRAPIPSAGT